MVAVPSVGRADQSVRSNAPAEADAQRLYEQYARQIQAYCFHQLGSREEAEDATQSTFLNAFRGLQRGVTPEFEMAWLYKIAHNVCLTRQRSSSRRRKVETPGDLDALQDVIPARQVDSDELIGLPEALNGMPKQQQRALLLREWQGLSYREIATELGLSQAAVETLLFRARRSLAAGLEEEPKKGLAQRVVKGGDAGSLLTLLKSLLVTGGTKVAATVATVAATSVVAATPAARHAVENAVVFASADTHRPAVPTQTSQAPAPRHRVVVRGATVPAHVRLGAPAGRKHSTRHPQKAVGAFQPRTLIGPQTRAVVTGGDVLPPAAAVPATPAVDPAATGGGGDPGPTSGSTSTSTSTSTPTSTASSGGSSGATGSVSGGQVSSSSPSTPDSGSQTGSGGDAGKTTGNDKGNGNGNGNTQQQPATSSGSGSGSTGSGSVSTSHGPGAISVHPITPTSTTPTTDTSSTPTTTTQAPVTSTTPTTTTQTATTQTTTPTSTTTQTTTTTPTATTSTPVAGVPHHH